MKYVKSGEGKMPLVSLLAILSISLAINLPGLAVSPMLGKLRDVFQSSELESQLLTSLPNLVMIPVVLLAGKIATPRWQSAVLATGLGLFLASGIASIFAGGMTQLIVLGCMGGVGCALVVPIAAGMISEWFVQKPRQRDLGLKSTTSNMMVIIANLYVGWVIIYNWHLAFTVYLVPVIPLLLLPFMTQAYIKKHRVENPASKETGTESSNSDAYHFKGRKSTRELWTVIALYVLLTYATTCISYYAPFMMEKHGMDTSQVGVVTAMYYLTVAISGATVSRIKRFVGKYVLQACLAVCGVGLIVMAYFPNYLVLIVSALCIGAAYGVVQPVIYNKTTYIAPDRKSGMKYFGYVLSSNYLSIMMVPFVDSFAKHIFHSSWSGFEFMFSGVVVLMLLLWSLWKSKNYVFNVNPDSPFPTETELSSH